MKSLKFESFNDAIKHLESQGTPTYQGRIGIHSEICLYILIVNGINHTVYVDLDGKVEYRD